eukprot:684222-Hanusia_phi.AAC.1
MKIVPTGTIAGPRKAKMDQTMEQEILSEAREEKKCAVIRQQQRLYSSKRSAVKGTKGGEKRSAVKGTKGGGGSLGFRV